MTKSLFDVFRESMLANPNGSRREAMDRFAEAMKADPVYLDMLARDYFERMSAVWTVTGGDTSHVFERTGPSAERGARISEAKAGVARLLSRRSAPPTPGQREAAARLAADQLAQYRATVRAALLDLPMPDGKLLRHATGAECTKAGGFYTAIGKHLKPTQVVDKHLTENDLQNIRARFYQANEAA